MPLPLNDISLLSNTLRPSINLRRSIPVPKFSQLNPSHILDIKQSRPSLDIGKTIQTRRNLQDISRIGKVLEQTSLHLHYIQEWANFRRQKFSALISFSLAALLILVSINSINIFYQARLLESNLTSQALQGLQNFKKIPAALNNSAQTAPYQLFSAAAANFDQAAQQIWFLNLSDTFQSSKRNLLASAQALVSIGQNISQAGIKFSEILPRLQIISQDLARSFEDPNQKAPSLTERLKKEFTLFRTALEKISLSANQLSSINPKHLPSSYQSRLSQIRSQMGSFTSLNQEIDKYFPALLDFLGDRFPRKYLILFANNNEQRAIMGFLGSGLILELNDGLVSHKRIFDIYEIDGQIVEKIPLPKVFESITGNWGLRDSNYSPDAAISGHEAARLYEKGGGEGVDGVFFVDLELLKKLLEVSGPIQLPNLPLPLTSTNFDQVLSYIVESKMSGVADPKKIIKDLVPTIIANLNREQRWPAILQIIPNLISEKHLLAYSKIDQIQELFSRFQLNGAINKVAPREDYLSIINTSISGNKSDYYIKEFISMQTKISANGQIVNSVTIRRQHTFNQKSEEFLKNLALIYNLPALTPELKKILGSGKNVVSTRIYVPTASRLKSVQGAKESKVEIRTDHELNLSYFQTQIETLPGSKSEITFTYELPYRLEFRENPALDDYQFTIQKQAGSRGIEFQKEIIFDPDLKVYQKLPAKNLTQDQNHLRFNQSIRQDQKLAVVFGK